VGETEKVINAVRELRYRIFLFTLYSMEMRLGECLSLKVSDIDSQKMQIHIRNGKGCKDRLVPLPQATLKALRFHWKTHQNPVMIFPNLRGARQTIKKSAGAQGCFKRLRHQQKNHDSFSATKFCNSSC
jgi:integrase